MKSFKNYISGTSCLFYFLLGIIISAVYSCQPEEFVDKVSSSPAVLKFAYPSLVNAVSMEKITKADEKIIFPVEVSLDEPAITTFNASLLPAPDVAASQSLTNAVVINTPDFTMPELVEVRFGTRKVSFDVAVSMNAIERNYGKNVVLAITLANPSKSQRIEESKKTVVFTINTAEVATIDELHFLSFASAVTDPDLVVAPLTAANLATNSVTVDDNYVSINSLVNLGGTPSKAFNTHVVYNQDTLNALAANGMLPEGTEFLSEDAFSLPDVEIADYKSSAIAEIKVSMDSIFAKYPSKIAVAFTLSNPQKFQVDPAKSTLVYLIDPFRVFSNVTRLLKNTSQPFRTSSVDPNGNRWGVLADWISNDQANQHQGYGSFDNNNGTQIAFESGWGSPNITNGKIYQTVLLPAGTYKFEVNARAGVPTDNTKGAYSIAAMGTTIPDLGAPTTPANFLGRAAINGGGTKSFTFTLDAASTVSLGFVAKTSGNQLVNVSKVTLTRTVNP